MFTIYIYVELYIYTKDVKRLIPDYVTVSLKDTLIVIFKINAFLHSCSISNKSVL